MTRAAERLFALVRATLRNRMDDASLFEGTDAAQWREIYDLSSVQGVLAQAWDGMQLLPEAMRPPRALRLQWAVNVERIEKVYRRQERAIARLAAFYREHAIPMMLLKGYGLSLFYPVPEHRPCGDIDIWLFGRQPEADKLVAREWGVPVDVHKEHHTTFDVDGIMVENHYDFVNKETHASNARLERLFKQYAAQPGESVAVAGVAVYLPSEQLNALFLLRHAAVHFAAINIGLRHVLDWCVFVAHCHDRIDWPALYAVARETRMVGFLNCLNALCGGCPNCHRACTSFPEQFIRHAFVRMLGESEVLSRDKTAAGVELDVCIPALRAAVEPGSWYWHRNLVERDREKRLLCERKGIRLITVYDHYDETAVPFDDCLVTPCDLASRRNMDKLVAVTKTLFGAFGLDSNLAAGEWETIRRRAELDSRRMTTEEFRAELAGINDKIEIIGEYTRASDKIRVRCKVCNHEWSVAPTTLRRGSGCASCAGRLKLTHERFVERLNLLHPEIVPLTEYVNSQTRMTFECRACGHVWSAQAYSLIAKSRSSGCRKCSVRAMLRRRSRKVRCITTGEVFDTLREAAAKYGVSRSAISQCCSEPPKLKRAGGREWEYVDLLSGER